MNTLLINESLVAQFKFWQDGRIEIGMNCRNGLYRLVARFADTHRYQAFDHALLLEQEGNQVVVTTTTASYTVWTLLRSPQAPASSPEFTTPALV